MENLWTVLVNFFMGFVNLIISPLHLYNFLNLETFKEKMSVIVLAGQSPQFFFMVFALVIILIAVGFYRRSFLRQTVYRLEMFNGRMGQFAAWFAILMMLQQVLIIAMGQIFRGNELVFAPFGMVLFDQELQWMSGQLKFYNAILIAFASAYTFIEGGHVRVDLIYSATKRRTQLWLDLIGTLVMFIPSTIMLWWFSWPLMTNSMFSQRPLNVWSSASRWRDFKWESSGTAEFSWVWSFKVLIVVFAGLMFITAIAFLLRNILALLEPDDEIPSHYSFEKTATADMGVAAAARDACRQSLSLGRPVKTPVVQPKTPTQVVEESPGHGV
ncbi:MAG: TRAP transporter small permease subunit [Devosiaceae bacterium]|nr:TRAP transporter small permease subunit [Devosiaceae bacterium]